MKKIKHPNQPSLEELMVIKDELMHDIKMDKPIDKELHNKIHAINLQIDRLTHKGN